MALRQQNLSGYAGAVAWACATCSLGGVGYGGAVNATCVAVKTVTAPPFNLSAALDAQLDEGFYKETT